jgi:hypothetical protein
MTESFRRNANRSQLAAPKCLFAEKRYARAAFERQSHEHPSVIVSINEGTQQEQMVNSLGEN